MKSAKVLIIECDPNLAQNLAKQADQLGYSVCGIALDLLDGISKAKELKADIALLDDCLVKRENSKDFIYHAGAHFSIPTILVLAGDDPLDMRRISREAKNGYLTRPFQTRELYAAIEGALYKAKLEHGLDDSERWFTDTLHCIADGVIAVDTDSKTRFLNLKAEEILGVSLESARDKKIEEILHFENVQGFASTETLRTGLPSAIDFGKWIRNHQQVRLPIDYCAAPLRDDNARPTGAVVVIRDASARLAAEEALKSSEERFRTAFEYAPEGMALVTMDGRFVQSNPALCRLLKCEEKELQRLNIPDITPPEDHTAEQKRLTELIAGNCASLQLDRRIIPRNGKPIWTQATISLLLREESPLCYLYQFHELSTQERRAPKAGQPQKVVEIHAKKNQQNTSGNASTQSRNAFIASMSHELRTPLNAILGFAQMLEKESPSTLTSGQRDSVRHIQRAGWRLLDLVNDALDLEKIESGQLHLSIEDVALQELLPECMRLVKRDADELRITVACGDIDYVVKADRIRLRQVVLNFLSNAIKYNRPGGSVVVTCKLRDDRVRIAVSDTGPGLSTKQKAHLFEPFNRLGKEAGTTAGSGIGLVITKSLVELMDGAIGVETRPGSGCIFWGELPTGGRDQAAPSPLKKMPKKAAEPTTRTILCIEDNPVNMLLVQKIMQQRPEWKLLAATTGLDGLQLAIECSPDLILLDIGLPDVSGLELIQRLRQHVTTQKIPVAAVSANACPEYIQQALANGFDRYITKPIHVPEFVQTVEGLFARPESRPHRDCIEPNSN